MYDLWERLWMWTTLVLGGIAIVIFLSFLLPLVFLFAFPFVLIGLGWLLVLWFRSLKHKNLDKYDENGARYTKATILSQESSTQEIPYDKHNSSS